MLRGADAPDGAPGGAPGERRRTKKSVTFCDQVTLVATAEDEQVLKFVEGVIVSDGITKAGAECGVDVFGARVESSLGECEFE